MSFPSFYKLLLTLHFRLLACLAVLYIIVLRNTNQILLPNNIVLFLNSSNKCLKINILNT